MGMFVNYDKDDYAYDYDDRWDKSPINKFGNDDDDDDEEEDS